MSLKPVIIGISGGSGSGKTTLARKLSTQLESRFSGPFTATLYQDSYYIDQSHRFKEDGGEVNFDHPDSLDFALLAEHLRQIKMNRTIQVPIYDFVTHKRLGETQAFAPRPVLFVDGILILSQPEVVKALDYSIFLNVPEQVRFDRRLKRDTVERGRTAEGVTKQFKNQVKPMHDLFVEPSQKFATWIIEQGNTESEEKCLKKCIEAVMKHIQSVHT